MAERAGAGLGRESLTLDHLIALNDEIGALVRTGLPLERGLREVGGDFHGRLSRVMTVLAERMSRGESLPEALTAERERLPRIYAAVVEAGLKAGRLAAALESLTGFVRAYLDARRAIGLALCYPLLVLVLAYGLFVLLVVQVAPGSWRPSRPSASRSRRRLLGAGWLSETVAYWGALLPVLLVAGIALWGWSGTSAGFRPARAWAVLGIFPWMSRMLRHYEAANFADLLGLLVEHGVPYAGALRLAAEATGDRALIGLGRDLAAAVERGDPPAAATGSRRTLPPLLLWLLTTGPQQASLARSLHGLAAIYRKQAERQADKIRTFLPILLLVGIGLSATLLFGLCLFLPFTTLLKGLAITE